MKKTTANINSEQECPVIHANLISKVLFWWTRSFVLLGLKKEYEVEDLYKNLPEISTKYLGDAIGAAWELELKKTNPSLHRAIVRVFRNNLLKYSGTTIFADAFCRCATGPALVLILEFFSGTTSLTNGLIGGFLLLMFSYLSTSLKHINQNNWDVLGMKIRVGLTSLVFKKGLKLSQKALGASSIGQITNIISNDVNRFDRGFKALPFVIYGPIQPLLVFGILVYYLGPTALFGILVLLFMIPLLSFLARLNGRIRGKSAIKTDYRIRLMNEIVNGILLIKMSAWEVPFSEYVYTAREEEMKIIKMKTALLSNNIAIQNINQRIILLVVLISFVKLSGYKLTASQAFLITSLLNVMKVSVTIGLPQGITLYSEIKTSVKRIQSFLLLEERMIKNNDDPFRKYYRTSTLPFVKLHNAFAKWTTNSNDENYSLTDVSLHVGSSQLLAIVGPVGSGKTTLIQAILRELPLENGTVEINGNIAYVPQSPWLFNASVRENILFGLPYKKEWFKTVIDASGLRRDIQSLPHGENTLIGERGINLSGGQKARINIARAVYSNADIYLLDDPFSALDAKVGREVFENVVQVLLREKCVILVTHLHQYLETASQILVLCKSGIVIAHGTFEELQGTEYLTKEGSELDKEFIIDDDLGGDVEGVTVRRISLSVAIDDTIDLSSKTDPDSIESDKKYGTFPVVSSEKEARTSGNITWTLYWKYFSAGNSTTFVIVHFMCLLLLVAGYALCDYWIKIWTSAEEKNIDGTLNENYYISILCGLILTLLLLSALYFPIYTLLINRSSICLHNRLFKSVIRAPMRFFEVNSYGRVFNRFVNDVGVVDDYLPTVYTQTQFMFQNLIVSIIFVTISSSPFMIIPAIGVIALILFARRTFIRPCSSLKRLEAICRSPIFSLFNTSLNGLTLIRGFGVQRNFLEQLNKAQDTHSSALYLYLAIARANAALVDWIANTYLTITLISFIFIDTDGASVGLALSAALLLTFASGQAVSASIELDNQVVSVERILEYSKVKPEASMTIYGRKPGVEWPKHGKIEFSNVYVKYGDDPPILSDISMIIQPREKIGIVGRTGAGKSSLIAALFRIVEPYSGTVHIDGCDISKIGLYDLRKKISIIPQSPILFIGTVRKNLDPFGNYNDEELWRALQDVQLHGRIRNGSSKGLDSDISEGGSNFSEGEKQLLCLARAILSQNKVLILDEATANIDTKTDALIQETIREKFQDCTILTIAHRLDTVMDSDRICVLETGRVLEFDTPYKLLQNTQGYLYNLCNKTGQAGFQRLVYLATQSYNERQLLRYQDSH